MGHPNAELIERFYAAFCRLDGDSMAACYAPGARFSDPVFIDLSDEQPGADVEDADGSRQGLHRAAVRARGKRLERPRALARGLHALDRAQGAQRRPRRISL